MKEDAPAGDGISREQKWALAIGGIALVIAGLATVVFSSGLSSGSSSPGAGEGSPSATSDSAEVAYPNSDRANSRWAEGPIQASTVSSLDVAWTHPLPPPQTKFGSYWATPVISNGVIYSQDASSTVQAIDLESGEVLWETAFGDPVEGQNGVVVANGKVFGATSSAAFALDQESGKELWSVPLTRSWLERITMPPGYWDGHVFVSTEPNAFNGGEVGILWALDEQTGKKAWHFDTVPRSLWGNPEVNYGGGLSEAPAFDGEGSMYVGIGNPGPIAGTEQQPWGKSRPGPNLYTGSIVKLDVKTGKVQWHYQLTPHALCEWDLQGPPMLLKSGGRDLVIAGGKAGIVIALDRNTGELIWKRSVGIHNGHDNDGLRAMRGDYSNLKTPMKVLPGSQGGVTAAPSTDGSTIFVPVVNLAARLITQERGEVIAPQTGELVALDVETGKVEWRKSLRAAPFGGTTTVNDLVLASTVAGGLYAFEASTGDAVWETALPTGMTAGIGVSGDTVVAPAGFTSGAQRPQMVAFRLSP